MPKATEANGDRYAFIKKLAANDRPTRDAACESLKQLLKTNKKMDSLECQRLWRGLYFTMWHSDRPRTQQAVADNLASLLDNIKKQNFFTFLDAFWKIIAREWDGIDRHRIDKFYLLIRRYLNHTFLRLKEEQWDEDWIKKYQEVMLGGPLSTTEKRVPNAIRLHLFDIYIDELEKILGEDFTGEDEEEDERPPFNELLLPVKEVMEKHDLKSVRESAKKYVFLDDRLFKWGVVEKPVVDEGEDSDEEEWGGFD